MRNQLDNKRNARRLRTISALLFAMVLLFAAVPANALSDTPTVKKLLDDGLALLLKTQSMAAVQKFKQILLLSPDHPEATFRIGQAYIQNHQVRKGLEFLEKAVEIAPKNVRYSLYLARIYEGQGRLSDAMKEYQRIIDTGTRDSKIKEVKKRLSLASGRSLAEKGELNAALLIFNGLFLKYPDDPQVLYNIGSAYFELNRFKEAENIFLELFVINKNNDIVNMRLAMIFEKTKRPKLAMKHLKLIIDQHHGNKIEKTATVEYNLILGRELMVKRDWSGVLKAFQTVVDLDPSRTEAFFDIAIANLQLGNTLMAERGFLSVLKMEPNNFVARLNLGELYYDMGKVDEALEQLTYTIKHDKSGKFAHQAKIRLNVIHTLIADKALASGNVEESLKEYEKALDYYSANVKASFNRGIIFIKQRKFDKARVEFESVVRHDPNNIRGRLNLANIYEQLGKYAEAAKQYEIVMEKGKGTREAKIAEGKWKIDKARGLWAERRLNEAEKIFKELTVEQPNNFQAFAFLGVIQASKGRLKAAASSYQRVLDLRPTNYAVRLLLGQVYEQLGMDTLAASEYRSILFAGGKLPQIPEAEQRLARVEARLSGFSNTLSYQYTYDSNLNMSELKPLNAIRSDLALSFNYALKTRDDLAFNLRWAPTYSNYHINRLDFLVSSLMSDARFGTPDDNWNIAFNRQDQDSLINNSTISHSTSLTIGRGRKLFLPAFLHLTPVGFEGGNISTSTNFSGGVRYINSVANVNIESLMPDITLGFNQTIRWGINLSISYTFSMLRNLTKDVSVTNTTIPFTDPLTGFTTNRQVTISTYDPRDYEFNSHTGVVNIQKVLGPGLIGNLSLMGMLSFYTNADSGAIARGQHDKRINVMLSVSPSITYNFFKDLSVVMSASAQKNVSTLPVGLSRSLQGQDAIASFQSSSLGNYTRLNAEVGFVMNF